MRANRLVAVFESNLSRDAAVAFCDTLFQKFWNICTFDVHWTPIADLHETQKNHQAARAAAEADLILISLGPHGEVPWPLQSWAEKLVQLRGEREGALIGLMEGSEWMGDRQRFLRELAHQAGLDFLTRVPDTLHYSIPDSLEWCSRRAAEKSSVLDAILSQAFPPGPLSS